MTNPAKWLARKLPLLVLLFVLALWRAQHGVAEIQGRQPGPLLAPETVTAFAEAAEVWRLRALAQLEQLKEALPR